MILRSLFSLKNFTKEVKHEIIIVNNDKKESLMEIKKNFPEIKILKQKKNFGFGPACNLGAKNATGELLFFLNPDAEIISGQLQDIFIEFLNEKIGVLGCKIITKSEQVQPWSAGVEKNLKDLFKNNLGIKRSKKIWESQKKITADWVAATAMFIRRDLFQRLGGFDEKFFMYFEDVDLCRRVQKTGKKIIYFPGLTVMHSGGSSFENKKNQKKHYYLSQEYYFKKHRSYWESAIVKILGRALSAYDV